MSMLQRPIKRTATKDTSRDLLVNVVPMTRELTYLWHEKVQPLVDNNYKHFDVTLPNTQIRADVGWNWVRWFYLAGLHNFSRIISRHGKALALCIVADTGQTGIFPIGMLTVVPQLKCTVAGDSRERSFAWYLADAPKEVYTTLLNIPPAKNIALALLDCGIQAALDLNQDGTLLLHADPNGGTKLINFYGSTVGMQRLPANSGPITPIFRRDNSEEYFLLDDINSNAFCKTFDCYR
jgi:hypothetical protein